MLEAVIIVQMLGSIYLALFGILYWGKCTLWKMHNDLVEWIGIGIGGDIIKFKAQRQEYQSYVKSALKYKSPENAPVAVVIEIRKDLESPSVFKKIYLRLLWLELKKHF